MTLITQTKSILMAESKQLTPEIIKKIKELAATHNIKQIAEKIGFSEDWTSKSLRSIGVKAAGRIRKTLAEYESEKLEKLKKQQATGIFHHDEYYKF